MINHRYNKDKATVFPKTKLPRYFVFVSLAIVSFLCNFSFLSAQERLIEMKESKYNNIYVYQTGGNISMTFGHNRRIYVESVYNPLNQLELPVLYTRYMTVGLAYPRELSSLMEIGLGAGRASWYVHKHLPHLNLTSVEIDQDVVLLAKKYFGIKEEPNFQIIVKDGRAYLARNKQKYDVIFIDAYRGPFVPFHLLTKEFYALVKGRLNAGGVVVQNIEPSTMLYDAALATMKSAFKTLETYEAGGNVVVIAYDGPAHSPDQLMRKARAIQGQYRLLYDLPKMIQERRIITEVPKVKILTDDFAPVEYLKAIERHNKKLN